MGLGGGGLDLDHNLEEVGGGSEFVLREKVLGTEFGQKKGGAGILTLGLRTWKGGVLIPESEKMGLLDAYTWCLEVLRRGKVLLILFPEASHRH